jgi:ElaA protein
MNWTVKPFDALTTTELYKLLQIRNEVFIVEQNCPYQDMDNKDFKSLHFWHEDAEGNVAAYCRILPGGVSYNEPSIGRVLTSGKSRKEGLGRIMMQEAIDFIQKEWEPSGIRIGAQLYLKVFYNSFGFEQIGDSYLEDDIPHIEMLKTF